MTWWDFVSDFINILNDIFNIRLFTYLDNYGGFVGLTVGGLLVSLLLVSTILFYFIPRR